MRWRRKPAGIDMEQNYVIVTLCICRMGRKTLLRYQSNDQEWLLWKLFSAFEPSRHICPFFRHGKPTVAGLVNLVRRQQVYHSECHCVSSPLFETRCRNTECRAVRSQRPILVAYFYNIAAHAAKV